MSTTTETAAVLERPIYRRDGQVRWGRLIVALAFSLAIAFVMALVLNWAFRAGWYFVVVVPIAGAIPVAAATYLVVKWSHCRNLAVAVFVGLFSGLVLYPGWFHIHMVSLVGAQAAHRVDLLPRFILFRLKNDAAGEIGKPANPPNVVTNSISFGVELFVVVCVTIGAAAFRVTRVYCNHCGEWARLAIHPAPAGSAALINQLLADNLLQQLPEIPRVPVQAHDPSATITVEACRQAGKNNSCCAFLTLKENPGTKSKAARRSPNLLNQAAITRDELGYLAARISGLVPLAPPGFIPEAAAVSTSKPSARPTRKPLELLARAETVSETDAASVYSARAASFLAALSFVPVVSFLAGCALLYLAWKLWPGIQPGQQWSVVSVACLVAGLLAVVFGGTVCWVNVDYFNTQRKFYWVRDIVALRRDAIVSPLDSQAIFVEVVPRENWTNPVTSLPKDGGFLVVDESRRELLFEGLKQRYRIPGNAILSCDVVNTSPDAGRFSFFATVVQAKAALDDVAADPNFPQVWEIPFMVRPVRFAKYNSIFRQRACEDLRARIQRMMSSV